jgi:hypothetical protein
LPEPRPVAEVSSNARADPGHLISDADAAMYRAKENGKARHEPFDDRVRDHGDRRMATENASWPPAETDRVAT